MSLQTYRVTYTIDGTEIIVFEFTSPPSPIAHIIDEAMNRIRSEQFDYKQVEDMVGFSIFRLPSLQ
ncbi:hypothetical protein [Paenibacillus sp. P46E]|uniref:hypothetical protein n=1 Tax=Paenibacillus sp. P46E TaxID=1349436 RepID=UPI00093CAC7B|nr:hypothetical protein [Paenibacillus sp. P46E]OKP97857.1 hypothetical protein A3849_13170 [Paenibacillus sp. P46E]